MEDKKEEKQSQAQGDNVRQTTEIHDAILESPLYALMLENLEGEDRETSIKMINEFTKHCDSIINSIKASVTSKEDAAKLLEALQAKGK